MGHAPIIRVPLPAEHELSPDPGRWPASLVEGLERDLARRDSRLARRRRRAYQACLALIEHREHVLGIRVWEPPPSPTGARPQFPRPRMQEIGRPADTDEGFLELVDGSGQRWLVPATNAARGWNAYGLAAHPPDPALAERYSPCPRHGWRGMRFRDGHLVCSEWGCRP